jgi:L-threonate 2-dehydrogenase
MSTEINSVGVIGLGSMGMGAAKSCINAGLDVYGFDLNPKALKELSQYGAKGVSESAVEFASDIDALLILVVNAQQVNSVLFESGLASLLKPETAIMVSVTMASDDAKRIEKKLNQHQLIMLDAPVSGGSVKAASGEMTVMASGSQLAFDKLKPLLDATATKVYKIGEEVGLGSTVKIIHQILAGVHIAAAAEAMALAARANIPLELMYDIVTHAAGNSWMFENRMKHVIDGDYSPNSMVDIFVKDLGLVADTAQHLDFPLPLSRTALEMFTKASNAGFGKEDDSAVIKIFEGIKLPGVEK